MMHYVLMREEKPFAEVQYMLKNEGNAPCNLTTWLQAMY